MRCADFRHPMLHNGTHQSERLAEEQLPENLQIDERDTKAFLNFAYEYAALLKYYNLNLKEDGNWQCFFSGGALGMLSIISNIDLAAIDDKYCRTELDFWKAMDACDHKNTATVRQVRYQALIDCIYELASKIDQLCKNTPNHLPFKQEIQEIIQKDLGKAIINNKIQNALVKLISYDKANRPSVLPKMVGDDPFLKSKYDQFIVSQNNNSKCTQSWGLLSPDDFFCIKPNDGFIEVQTPDQCKENRKLRKLFFIFFQALSKIVQRAEYHLKIELQNSSAQEPHISLYLAFIFLFRRLISQLNHLTEAHLDFYYKKVLCLPFKGLTPDEVYVIFELAKGFDNFILAEQTPLDAGNDSEGNKLEYRLHHDIVVDNAQVEACHALFLSPMGTGYKSLYSINSDQIGGALTEAIRWQDMNAPLLAQREKAVVGIAISDPILKLKDGTRFIVLDFKTNEDLSRITKPLDDLFRVYLSSDMAENGWLEVPAAINSKPFTELVVPRRKAMDQNQPMGLTENVTYGRDSKNNVLITSKYDDIELSSFSVQVGPNDDVTDYKYKLEVRILIKKNSFPINLPKEGDPLFQTALFPILKVTFSESLLEFFDIKNISNVSIATESAGVSQGVQIRNSLGVYNNQGTFPLLGLVVPAGENTNKLKPGSFVEFELEELQGKQLLGLEPFPQFITPSDNDAVYPPLPKDLILEEKQDITKRRFNTSFRLVEELVAYPTDSNSNAGLPLLPGLSTFIINFDDIFALPIPKKSAQIVGRGSQASEQIGFGLRGVANQTVLAAGLAQQVNIARQATNLAIKAGQSIRAISVPTDVQMLKNLRSQPASPRVFYEGTPSLPGRAISPKPRTEPNTPPNAPTQASISVYSALTARNILTLEYVGIDNDYFQDSNTKLVKGVTFRYASVSDFLTENSNTKHIKKEFERYYITPNGYNLINPLDPEVRHPLLPEYHLLPQTEVLGDAPSNRNALAHLDIGIRELTPGQQLSLLFEMEEGTGNPNFDPPLVRWFYLAKDEDGISDEWRPFRAGSVFLDTTSTDPEQKTSLLQTGIVILTTAPEMTNQGTSNRPGSGLYWIRATLYEDYTPGSTADRRVIALPHIKSIRAQAAIGSLHNRNNTLDHLPDGLPVGRIAKLVNPVQTIKTVEQPLKSINGRLPEDRNAYYLRVSERLRHKDRAINIWDYERLVLEQFPEVLHAKAISHTSKQSEIEPGKVMVAVFPDLKKRTDISPLTPGFPIGKLEAIEDFLRRHSNMFLYCDENIQVVNPLYELIRVKACVRFHKGFSPAFYATQLNQDLHNFLAPWVVNQNTPLHFSGSLHTSTILNFMEERPYVDVVSHFLVYHFTLDLERMAPVSTTGYDIRGNAKPVKNEMIRTRTAHSILTTYPPGLKSSAYGGAIGGYSTLIADPPGHDIRLWGDSCCKDCLAPDFTSFKVCK